MGSGAFSGTSSNSSVRARQPQAQRNASAPTRPRRSEDVDVENISVSYWCHQCQVTVNRLGDGSVCPLCQGGFVQETSSISMLAQAARWLTSGSMQVTSTQMRIARLLDDLHAHLQMVEGLHETMRSAMDQPEHGSRPHLDPATQQVLDAIEVSELDAQTWETMRQTAQCVICCADFEVGERLSRLPGCGHHFHDACVRQWLERASNCPICRGDLLEAVTSTENVGDREDLEEASDAAIHTEPTMRQLASSVPSQPPSGSSVTPASELSDFSEGPAISGPDSACGPGCGRNGAPGVISHMVT